MTIQVIVWCNTFMWMQTKFCQTSAIGILVNTYSLVDLLLHTVTAHVWLLVKHSKGNYYLLLWTVTFIHCGSGLQKWWLSQLISPPVQWLSHCSVLFPQWHLLYPSWCISHLYLPMLKNGCNFIEEQLPLSGVWKPLLYLSCTGTTSDLAPSDMYPLEL